MNPIETAEREDRGRRAEAALREFLAPAIEVAVGDYIARMTEIAAETPWETARIAKLAAGVKIARAVQAQIAALVADGEVAAAERKRARQIEAIGTERRRVLGI